MIKYHLKIGWRSLLKNKKLFAINIGGLAFGMSICLAILLFFLKEYSFDRYHDHADHIYRLVDRENNSSAVDYRVKDLILANFPGVDNACLVQVVPDLVDVNHQSEGYYLKNIMSTDNAFFEMFSVPFLKGNPDKPFENMHSAILTESAAKMMFEEEDPLGKEIMISHSNPVIVTGVIRNFPDNSSIQANILVNGENDAFKFSMTCSDCRDTTTIRRPFGIYLQLNKQSGPDQFISQINTNAHLLEPYLQQAGLLPLKEMYLNDFTNDIRTKKGNPGLLTVLGIIGVIVLSLAFINYNNLLMARQTKRNQGTGVRKIFGALSRDLYGHFFAESILLTWMSFVVAFFILMLTIPFYRNIFDRPLDVSTLLHFPVNILLLLAVLVLGIVAGASPALVYSSFNPLKIFKGETFIKGRRNRFRNGLTTFQFAVSIGLITGLIAIRQQIQFVREKKTGFSEEQLLRLDLPYITESDQNDFSTLMNNLQQYPEIRNMALSNGVPGRINMFLGAGIEGKKKSVASIFAGPAFIETFDIKVVEGRLPTPSEIGYTCVINQAAFNYFDWNRIEGKIFNNGRPDGFKVVGVVEDFHFHSLHKTIEPLCIMFTNDRHKTHLSIRLEGDRLASGLDNILREWKKVLPDYALKYEFFDDWFDSMYRQEEKFASTIGLFALLAISISCIGILGLAMFNAESRIREIGIRKVLGASVSNILLLLTKEFSGLVVIAFAIAVPIANYLISEWLEAFAYRIEITWWLFAIPGLLVLAMALLIVGGQSLKAAGINPVESLRSE